MKTEINDKVLIDMVFDSLCRILKNKKIYHRFRCFIGCGHEGENNSARTIYANLKSMQPYVKMAQHCRDNPFYHTSNKEDIFHILRSLLGNGNIITKDDVQNMEKVQTRITQVLNTLLHSCVEKAVKDFSEVEKIGQETFDMVCKAIYGDDFVDVTEKCIPNEIKTIMLAQKEYLERHGLCDPRTLTKDPRFMEYLKGEKMINQDEFFNSSTPLRPEWWGERPQALYFNDDWIVKKEN